MPDRQLEAIAISIESKAKKDLLMKLFANGAINFITMTDEIGVIGKELKNKIKEIEEEKEDEVIPEKQELNTITNVNRYGKDSRIHRAGFKPSTKYKKK